MGVSEGERDRDTGSEEGTDVDMAPLLHRYRITRSLSGILTILYLSNHAIPQKKILTWAGNIVLKQINFFISDFFFF